MKLITLNTWGGRITKELLDFVEKHRGSTDIFCFQEMYHQGIEEHVPQENINPDLTLFEDIQKSLPEHQGYFRAHYYETFGLAAFVKRDLVVVEEDEFFVHKFKGFMPTDDAGNHGRNVQRLMIQQDGGLLHVFNFHGLWNGGGKGDSDPRLEQSRKLAGYIQNYEGAKVLCGDFNLSPDTESLKMIEALPLRNLVKEYGVTSTRTSYYKKENRFADYVLVNDKVEVIDFQVLPDEVSDHSALMVEFE